MDNTMSRTASTLKPTVLLATMLFLVIAPQPDASDIAEMTANFIVPDQQAALMASDELAIPVHEEPLR